MGIPVARIELLDTVQMRACNAYSKLSYAESPTLFLEFHGTDETVPLQSSAFGEIAAECGGGEFLWTANAEERTKLWKARHDAYWSARALAPGLAALSTDVCVPISRLADCVSETQADIEEHGLLGPIVGHVQPCRRIERAEWLIHQDDSWRQDEGARNRDALPHAVA